MQETQEGTKSVDGFYKHKDTGTVVELINEPGFGTPLTNSFIKAGYEQVGKTDPKAAVVEKTSPIATKEKE